MNKVKDKKTKKRSLEQMYLDLGQRNFGRRTICKLCGMLVVEGVAEDIQQHAKICKDYKQGVAFCTQGRRVVANFAADASSIVEVSF